MSDGLKITIDKRHRSSSSIARNGIEGTRSERKLDLKSTSGTYQVSIPEGDDRFALAESRCNDLKDKLELVRDLKRRRKLKKQGMAYIEQPSSTEVPLISVRTQLKKRLKNTPPMPEVPQQLARLRRLEPANPARGYQDPATLEQHRMLSQVRKMYSTQRQDPNKNKQVNTSRGMQSKQQPRRARADGDSMTGLKNEVACGDDESINYNDVEKSPHRWVDLSSCSKAPLGNSISRQHEKSTSNYRRHVPKDVPPNEEVAEPVPAPKWRTGTVPKRRFTINTSKPHQLTRTELSLIPKDARSVVEIFNLKGSGYKHLAPDELECKSAHETNFKEDDEQRATEEAKEKPRIPRTSKYRTHRYEMPTVASQMKQSGGRYYGSNKFTNIPFVISKSCAPSHNIGVNIQQVLNGLKIQQPLSGIPLTIAHHMGLGHIPAFQSKNMESSSDNRKINAIRLGRRLLRLPSYKYMSYNRLLTLYRESDGMVARFLRAVNRPQQFYTSMYNLATREDFDDVTTASKKRRANQMAKQNLTEYAALYREYEQINRQLKEGFDPDLERRKEELVNELATREDNIRRVVQDYRTSSEIDQSSNLRSFLSATGENYRYIQT